MVIVTLNPAVTQIAATERSVEFANRCVSESKHYCRITRESIDACETYFRDGLRRNNWQLIVELKKLLATM
ncbi:hypothetical protein GCK32_008823 [Trichostrongylus colubriformis]|uniref:Uncharacterized protein n=1 Tax=Trichostrongylus colubriformis TaxID=6319 RepID=A0AAN8ICR1_TRICO